MIMTTIISALVGLAVLAGVAAPASAADADGWTAQHFWQEQQDRLP
jgi:hypothetical protein